MISSSAKSRRLMHGVAAGALAVSLIACENNQQIGAIAGGVTGAVAASQIGSGKGQIVAMVVGVAAGAWLGSELGKMLDEGEQEQLAKATQETATTGESSSWTNPDSGTTVKTSVVGESTKSETVEVPLKKSKIKTGNFPPFTLIGKEFEATANSNVRGGPGTDYVAVGSLREGEVVDVIGKVDGKPWYIIGENGVGNGFVYAELLKESENYAEVVLADPDAQLGSDVALASVPATGKCREIQQTVVLKDGQERTETLKACEGPNGWETQDTV